MTDRWLIAGLGNPGPQYAGHRHNAGFMVVDELAARYGGRFKGSKQRADTARISIEGTPVLLAKPITFMKTTGTSALKVTLEARFIPVFVTVLVRDKFVKPVIPFTLPLKMLLASVTAIVTEPSPCICAAAL